MTTTFQQFTLETLERRYLESLSLPYSASRDLVAWEYIGALEEALHEALRGRGAQS